MKKISKSLFIVLVMLFAGAYLFSSCTKDDESVKGTLMNHDWELTTIESGDEALTEFFTMTYDLVQTTYQFQKNDKLVITSKFLFASDKEEGTWSVSDDGKELTINGSTSEILELTSKVLKIGPSEAIMGDYDAEGDTLSTFNYAIIFDAK
jgi:hypothetical protein